jgi:hypothetical protein
MNRIFSAACVVSLLFGAADFSLAASKIIDFPVHDGEANSCNGCNPTVETGNLFINPSSQGIVKFGTGPISGVVTHADLVLFVYAVPVSPLPIDVYGYGTTTGPVVAGDLNAGTFLASLTPSINSTENEAFIFDVTNFVATTHAPFLAFNLRSQGFDGFASLEYNHGLPSQLVITFAPEPTTCCLLIVGGGAMLANSLRKRFRCNAHQRT